MIEITDRNAPLTVVAFSGLAPFNHVYEWVASLSRLPVNVVGVKDPHDAWWRVDVHEILPALRSAIGARPWVALGGSAGGFGAILFGRLMHAARVVAFVPQSACGDAKRRLGDLRWPEACARTPSADLATWGGGAEIHVGEDALDVMHAERFQGARITRYPGIGHDLPHVLKREGRLAPILEGVTA